MQKRRRQIFRTSAKMKGHENTMKAMFAIHSHSKCCENLRLILWLYFASDVVFRSDGNSLYCAVLIDVISERFENVINISWSMKRFIGCNGG